MNKMKKIRLSKKLTLGEVAKALGCTTPAIYKWENNQRIPTPKYMKKIMEWSKGEIQPNDFYKQ